MQFLSRFVTNRFIGLLLSFGILQADAAPAEKFNVLLIIADDLNTDLGCYGHPLVKSPNIDKLAERGVKFEKAYCQFSLCSPSRSSFLTGRRPSATGVLKNPGPPIVGEGKRGPHFREFIPDTVTLPQLFRQNRYYVARVGKMFHYHVPAEIGTDGLDDPPSWEQVVNPRGRDKEDEDEIFTLKPHSKTDRFGATLSWLAAKGTDREQTDGIGAEEAIKLLEQHKDRPFFLGVGFFRPHTPYVAPKKYFDLYPLDKITVPSTNRPTTAPLAAYATARAEEDKMTERQRKEAIQAYHAATSFMDAQVGKVVDALDRLKLAEKTVIIFMSDHGYHMGEHGLWQKKTLFENAAHVPLIIVPPKFKATQHSSPRTVELVDLYPTLADLCGLKAPAYLDGISLRPWLKNPDAPRNVPAYTQVWREGLIGYSVRTEKWRYTEWNNGKAGAELYDHDKDPGELTNLFSRADAASEISKLRVLLDRNWPNRMSEEIPPVPKKKSAGKE